MAYVKGPKVLDVGFVGGDPKAYGQFWLHDFLVEKFERVVGIDISEKYVAELSAAGYKNLHVASAENFSVDEKFDTVVAGELIEHLANPGLFLDRAKAHLADGGRVVVSTPYPFSLLYLSYALFKFPKTCGNAEHTCWFCLSTIKETALRSGLKLDHWELVEDYRFDTDSFAYGVFVRLLWLYRFLIPQRLKANSILVVFSSLAA